MTSQQHNLAILLLSLLILGCAESTNPSFDITTSAVKPAVFNAAAAPTVEFSLPDMMCEDGCAWTVKDILSKQPGAKDVRVDFEAKTATVAIEDGSFDSQLALAELVDKGFSNTRMKGDQSQRQMSESELSTQAADRKALIQAEQDSNKATVTPHSDH